MKKFYLIPVLFLLIFSFCNKKSTEPENNISDAGDVSPANLSGKIAFVESDNKTNTSKIVAVDSDGSNKVTIIDGGKLIMHDFKFSPNSQYLAYKAEPDGPDGSSTYLYSFTDKTEIKTYHWPEWSPDSKLIATIDYQSLLTMDNALKNQKELANPVIMTQDMKYGYHATDWSPTGNSLAFVTETRTGHTKPFSYSYDLWMINKDGSNKKIVIPNFHDTYCGIFGVSWNPSGTVISVGTNEYGKELNFFDFSTKKKISSLYVLNGSRIGPFWVTDSEYIYDDNQSISLYGIDGEKKLTYADNSNNDWAGITPSKQCLSKDRKKIVYSKQVDDYFEIFTCNVDGSDVKQITSGYMENYYPCWIP